MSPAPLSCGPAARTATCAPWTPAGRCHAPRTPPGTHRRIRQTTLPFEKWFFLFQRVLNAVNVENQKAQGKEKLPLNLSPGEELITFWVHRFSRLFSPPHIFSLKYLMLCVVFSSSLPCQPTNGCTVTVRPHHCLFCSTIFNSHINFLGQSPLLDVGLLPVLQECKDAMKNIL